MPKRFFTLLALLFIAHLAKATQEPYINELRGPQVAVGNSFTVADEKFGNSTAWASINQNIAVNDIVTFEINFDTSIYFYNHPFNCALSFKIYIYGNTADSSQITDSTTFSSVALTVRYDTITGKAYKGIAMYKFRDVYKYKVKILGLTSAELSPIPAIFRVKGQVIVDREYNFTDTSTDTTRFSVVNGNQLKLNWTPSNYPGAESFDIEYTQIDDSSVIAAAIRGSYLTGTDEYTVPSDTLEKWFRNHSVRVNVTGASYLFDIPYNSGFILFRIRGTLVHYADGIRWEGNWNYAAKWLGTTITGPCPTGVVHFADHEPGLNWQYSVAFAEDGKRKEVMSYFGGDMHNRQSVTISNTENRAIVQETIYDNLGRPAMQVLPAPTLDSTLHYYKNFNRNLSGDPYSFTDYSQGTGCTTDAAKMSIASGASRYYSENNDFLSTYYYAKYIPKADSLPFAVTEYMADNTGRIMRQGGVGPTFQINSGHETKYFYGKPSSQDELDRLFGTEAGNFTHSLKNMVIDPNGGISVSYVDASGKTVATALAGAAPDNLHPLPSSAGAGARDTVTSALMSPDDFVRDGGNYSLTASSTFLAPVTGDYILDYQVDPLKLEILYGPDKDSVICSTCYYDLDITVKNACDSVVGFETRAAGHVFDTACSYAGAIQDTMLVRITAKGEYYVTYRLRVSKDALDYYDSVHLVKNSDIRRYNSFLLDELKQTDFTGCYNNCETCKEDLGSPEEFFVKFKTLYTADSIQFGVADSLYTLQLYASLLDHCAAIQATCHLQSVCDEKLDLLKMDVTPGGQYALYNDSTFQLTDTATNVLTHRNLISFFPDGNGGRDSVTLKNIDGDDSLRVDVKDLNDSLFIANWKDAWADSLVRLHPEYCYYLWCVANSSSYEFDKEVENWMDADTVRAMGWFDPNNYKALLDHDPFFDSTGKGFAFYNQMRDSLLYFSRTMVGTSQADKNILQLVDIVLYCKTQYNGWDACDVDSGCRSRYREWFMYKELYLNLKQKFYEAARRTDPDFVGCTNCFVGHDLLGDAGLICTPLPTSDFEIQPGDVRGTVKFVYTGLTPIKHRMELSYTSGFGGTGNAFFEPGITEVVVSDSALTITDISCAPDSVYHNFTDSTCNYRYPDGTYQPFDRDSVSYFIQYGDPYHTPTGTPSGYGNCRFYPVFNLKTGAKSSKNFFNVWICTYDSTCGGVCTLPTAYPSECAGDSRAALYQDKIRRYPEYVNTTDFLSSIGASNAADASATNEASALNECHENCNAQADYWISTLGKCTTDTVKLAQLKAALIDVCSNSCQANSLFGASTAPAPPAAYESFEDAIVGILGPSALNDSCTADLLSDPYPAGKQPILMERVVSETDYGICAKISTYKTEYQGSGFSGSFHAYLKNKLGSSYRIDSTELDDLMHGCTSCNGMLQFDISLPLAFEPSSHPCLTCTEMAAAKTAFDAKYPTLDTASINYELIFRNFMNHRFGFSLSFDAYQAFIQRCGGTPAAILCDQVAQPEVQTDPVNSCTNELFATAETNAQQAYVVYIDSVRREFRNAYMTKCMNVQPSLKMKAELYEYHYTLYYYDQSGNLVKTVPPEGVTLLTKEQIDTVNIFRRLQSEGCYQYSDSVKLNNNGQVTFPAALGYASFQPFSIEARVNLSSSADQIILSQITEENLLTGPDSIGHKGYILSVDGGKLKLQLYAYFHAGLVRGSDTAIAVSNLNLSQLLPTNTWRHLVLEFTADTLAPWKLLIDGNPVALSYTKNTLSSIILTAGSPLMIGSHNAADLANPGKLRGTIKNLRIYNRLLGIDEIRQNAYNNCQTPANTSGMVFWAPLNSADSNKVRDLVARHDGTLTGFTWSPFVGMFNDHRLVTTYQYNSLNQPLQQYSPDGDTTQFFYDRLGRLNASQNKEQETTASYSGSAGRFSYTKYDQLGRTAEVGEKSDATDIRTIDLLDTAAVKSWLTSGTNRQITKTIYDNPVNVLQSISASRKRVTASVYLEAASDTEGDSTLYVYDISGNVKTLIQHVKALVAADPTNGKKRIDYDFDLVSGKVNQVSYQEGKGDQFFYRYSYDADNRIVRSLTSRDQLVWTEDANYQYYLHGPLARTELGNYKVQGVDYAYTLQGWMKGINGDALNPATEMGGDGQAGSMYSRVSRDVYAFKIGYNNSDYEPIGSTGAIGFDQHIYSAPLTFENTGNQLFNGNISYTTMALSKFDTAGIKGYSYGYDQLNRLTYIRQHNVTAAWSNSDITSAYAESIAYDANGNILRYLRKGANTSGNPLDMDSLNYKYHRGTDGRLVNNRLNHVRDQVDSSNYAVDIDDQAANNYHYDQVGNIKKDVAEGIDTIRWTVYGKINRIVKNVVGIAIDYSYGPGGSRSTKKVSTSGVGISTYYVRDNQGNIISIYSQENTLPVTWSDQILYGTNRLGMYNLDIIPSATAPNAEIDGPYEDSLLVGKRSYELTSHLGNIHATISDKKNGHDSSGAIDYYIAEVLTQNDYYSFGMEMPSRKHWAQRPYGYGFNGKENDNDVRGEGNEQDYGNRIYDLRLGRFLSVDPIAKEYSELTPYQFANNSPIQAVDLDGLEGVCSSGLPMGNGFSQGMLVDKQTAQKVNQYHPEVSRTLAMSLAIAVDVFVTKGWATRILLASQALGSIEHNRATTPEGRAAQDRRSREALADAIITYGGGKLLGVSFKLGVPAVKILANRLDFARKFYLAAGYSAERTEAHLAGIDLSEKVFSQTLKKGTILEQWAYMKDGKPIMGDYFTTPGADPTKLGIPLKDRVKIKVVLTEDTEFLRSTTGEIDNWNNPGDKLKGGGNQLFKPNAKYQIKSD